MPNDNATLARRWGRRIRERRKLLQLTQEALAAAVGVDQTTISKWEKGVSTPRDHHRPKLAAALQADAGVLFEYPVAA